MKTLNTLLSLTLVLALAAQVGDFARAGDSDPHGKGSISLTLRHQQPTSENSIKFHRMTRVENWQPSETAVIVCDMWDSHHCVNAVRRVSELAPRIDSFCSRLREQGVTVIHAPSSCMQAYENHSARLRAVSVPAAASMPEEIASWCDQIPAEEAAAYPLDQSEGGEDDDLEEHRLWAERLESIGRNPKAPWLSQVDAIEIDGDRDYISDSGTEIWSILTANQIENVILVGVHTNMCVLGRPFGLRRLATAGKRVVLARDLTDTMYDPRAWPYASHFTGTDLIIDHIERFVCPTISSDQVLGGRPFRYADDQRKRLVVLVAEDEYETDTSLPRFAAKHLSEHFSVTFAWGSDSERNEIVGMESVANADALLISVRRRALPEKDLALLKQHVDAGKPVIGIRTANHAFSLRGKTPPEGKAVWESFDADVFGGNYTNHYGNSLKTELLLPDQAGQHSIVSSTVVGQIRPAGSLYKVAPLAAGTQAVLYGKVPDTSPEPVAWTFIRSDGGRSFYTSLGHPKDFEQDAFEAFLSAGVHWACGLKPHPLEAIKQQNERYAAGGGKQRK